MTSPLSACSEAELRELAQQASPDPFEDLDDAGDQSVCWLYGPGEYELGTLERLVDEGFAANRFVHYATNFGPTRSTVHFRRALVGQACRLQIRSSGRLLVHVGPVSVPTVPAEDGWSLVELPAEPGFVEFEVSEASGSGTIGIPAAVAKDQGLWSVGVDASWVGVGTRHGSVVPPHLVGEPVQTVTGHHDGGGIYTFPAPALGHVVVQCAGKPMLRTGESMAEVRSSGESETRHDVEQEEAGTWRSRHQLGLRYLSVAAVEPTSVRLDATVRPVPRRGAFVCSDPRLNRIWGVSAYTLRLCMQRLLIDGIKRDRMPWAGDQALSTLANAYAFADDEISRDSSTASGRLQHGYVNGIADYSLWWVINNGLLQQYFGGDRTTTARRADAVNCFVTNLFRSVDGDGVFRPEVQPDGFEDSGAGSVFFDWGVKAEVGRDLTALQMLWIWAVRTAVTLLEGAGHRDAHQWRHVAGRSMATLVDRAWDNDAQAWREYLEPGARTDSAYPNFLAVLCGATTGVPGAGVKDAIEHGEVGTPFMTAFALRAQGLIGQRQGAVRRIRESWGAMLDSGALTFWEEFASARQEPHAMYGRPFGKSLCHAWSAGPAALLPELILGVRPLTSGWRRFEVDPELGQLDWAAAVVPAPGGGTIVINADPERVEVEVPDGLVLERPGQSSVTGPCRASWTPGRE